MRERGERKRQKRGIRQSREERMRWKRGRRKMEMIIKERIKERNEMR